jgi:hypothetical protein
MSSTSLTGRWIGYYLQRGREYPISADFLEAGERLSGFMYDGQPDREYSVSEIVSEVGLPPGTDEEIESKLREFVGNVPAEPIRYVTHLPPNSTVQGRRTGQAVCFLKTYQGTSYGGYRVGDRLVGTQNADHRVHYEGQISPDGLVIEGRWRIEANAAAGTPETGDHFHLRLSDSREIPSAHFARIPEVAGPTSERQTFKQQAVPIAGAVAGLGVAAGVTYLYGFRDKETIEQVLLLALWLVGPMIGAVIGGTLVGLEWIPRWVHRARFATSLIAAGITVALVAILLTSLDKDTVRAIVRGPGLPIRLWLAILMLPVAGVWAIIWGLLTWLYHAFHLRRRD